MREEEPSVTAAKEVPDCLHFRRIGGHFAAECSTPILLTRAVLANPELCATLRAQLHEHGVLVFHDQNALQPEDELALARIFEQLIPRDV